MAENSFALWPSGHRAKSMFSYSDSALTAALLIFGIGERENEKNFYFTPKTVYKTKKMLYN